ncbi:hypothetical protein P8605_05685 [Streptomyces sp. T-3]|nr:hypothetical protein [Streptomyces sp. T-3]
MTWKQWAASKRLKPGNGRELQRFRWWQLPLRSLFWLRLPGAGGHACLHAVDVRHWARLLWLNLALGVGAVLASMKRALRLRYSPLLDAAGH